MIFVITKYIYSIPNVLFKKMILNLSLKHAICIILDNLMGVNYVNVLYKINILEFVKYLSTHNYFYVI